MIKQKKSSDGHPTSKHPIESIVQLSFVLLLMILLACSQQDDLVPTDSPEENSWEVPIFSDVDVEFAMMESVDLDEDIIAEDSELFVADGLEHELADEVSEFSTQKVLTGAQGYIYYVQYNAKATRPWRIYRHDQTTNKRVLLYSSKQRISSVAGSTNGLVFAFTQQDRKAQGGDEEIYRATLSDHVVRRLTNNKVHDVHVSMSADAQRIVWQTTRAGKEGIIYRTYTATGKIVQTLLKHPDPQIQPSVTANGRHIAAIRLKSPNQVVLYTIGKKYRIVRSSKYTMRHPSASDDAKTVAWLQTVGRSYLVNAKDLRSGDMTILAKNTTGIHHPHLKSDAAWLTYGVQRRGSWDVITKNLQTGSVAGVTLSSSPTYHSAMYWQHEETPKGLPDLVITRASLSLAQRCEVSGPVMYATATVKNIGTDVNPTPEVGMVSAIDTTNGTWGNGAFLGALAPGESKTVSFPVHYFQKDPAYMLGTHSFEIEVNRGKWIAELDTTNNSYGEISITIPHGFCDVRPARDVVLELKGLSGEPWINTGEGNCTINDFDIPGQGWRINDDVGGITILEGNAPYPDVITPEPVGADLVNLASPGSLDMGVALIVVDDFNGIRKVQDSVFELGEGVFKIHERVNAGDVVALETELAQLEMDQQLSHGALVMNHISALLDATKLFQVDYSSLTNGVVKFIPHSGQHLGHIKLKGVDTENLTTTVIANRMSNAINEAVNNGYSKVVVNMSFSIVPCGIVNDFEANREQFPDIESYTEAVADANAELKGEEQSEEGFANSLIHVIAEPFTGFFKDDALYNFIRQTTEAEAILYVASAGNYGLTFPMFPAAWQEVVGVSASNASDALDQSIFSNSGEVMSTGAWFNLTDPETGFVNPFIAYAGTSFSAPNVATFGALDFIQRAHKCQVSPITGKSELSQFDFKNLPLEDAVLGCTGNP